MGLKVKGVINRLFANSKEEKLGIGEKEKERSSASIKAAGDEITLTTTFQELTAITLTHESKTGRVLVIFSGNFSIFSDDGNNGDTVRIKLQKDGVDVSATLRNMSAFADTGGGEIMVVDMCGEISTIDLNAEKNTWRIMAKTFGTSNNSFIDERNLMVIDI